MPLIFTPDDITKGILRVPTGDGPPVALDMNGIAVAEARIREIQGVNSHKAPELLSLFNRVYLDLNDYIRQMEVNLHEVQKKAEQRRAVVILDLVPEILAKKGVVSPRTPGGSEDQREAVLAQDQEYQAALSDVSLVKACIALLKGKQEGIEMAYSSVKKIIGDTKDWRDLAALRTSAGADPDAPAPAPAPGRSHTGFGTAR